ncbi:hypothetical protein HK405_005017 [Cladochytrium tenue]|nr:hypothetical protein HK405_005017 [Cladochytrium tenue]
MRSRRMYDSLKFIRPDLADNTPLRIFVVNSSGYGNLVKCLYSPVVLVDEDDPRDNDEPCKYSGVLASKESSLSRLLIQVAMRNCWMDELAPFLAVSPSQVAVAAVLYGHANLLRLLTTHPDSAVHPAHVLGDAKNWKKPCFTSNIDLWEWFVDLIDDPTGETYLRPVPTSLPEAQRVLDRLPLVHADILRKIANTASEEAFALLWPHRANVPDGTEHDGWLDIQNPRDAQAAAIDLGSASCTPAAVALAHEKGYKCDEEILSDVRNYKNMPLLTAFDTHCKCCPEFDWRSDVVGSAGVGDQLEKLLWAIKQYNPCLDVLANAFISACRRESLSTLHFLARNYSFDTITLWKAYSEACRSNSPAARKAAWRMLIDRGDGALPEPRPARWERLFESELLHASLYGYYDVARQLCNNKLAAPSSKAVGFVVSRLNLRLLRYFRTEAGAEECDSFEFERMCLELRSGPNLNLRRAVFHYVVANFRLVDSGDRAVEVADVLQGLVALFDRLPISKNFSIA